MSESQARTRVVVGVAGPSKSGKTRLSSKVASQIGAGLGSFGDVVRETARSRGLDSSDPHVLLSLGSSMVDEDCEGFCQMALSAGGWPSCDVVILDGVRHTKVVATIKRLVGRTKFRLIMVTATPESRARRFRESNPGTSITLNDIDAHPISHEADILLQSADFIADGDAKESDVAHDLARTIESWRR